MRVVRHFRSVPTDAQGAVVAIGNFDGIHRGHRSVIAAAARIAGDSGAPAAVLTFEPHPRSFFSPAAPPFRLTSLRDKIGLIRALGPELFYVLRFDRALADMTATEFVHQVLVEGFHARHLVVGYDFVFGHRRAGDTKLLATLGREHGIGVTVVAPASEGEEPFSSSQIRAALKEGEPRRAAQLLGGPWQISARVVRGDERGRELGYPTANLRLGDYLEPAHGIYAVRAGLVEGGRIVWRDAVANLGRRPTFGGGEVFLEVHLFDYAGDLYGRRLGVIFVEYLREERKYDDVEALKRQMARDCEDARRLLAGRDDVLVAPGSAPLARQRAGS